MESMKTCAAESTPAGGRGVGGANSRSTLATAISGSSTRIARGSQAGGNLIRRCTIAAAACEVSSNGTGALKHGYLSIQNDLVAYDRIRTIIDNEFSPVLAGTAKAKDVAPIVYKNCAECHRPTMFAPMSLMSYDEARPYARAIKAKVLARQMPPWGAPA